MTGMTVGVATYAVQQGKPTLIERRDLGWDDFFSSQIFQELEAMETTTARVTRHDGESYEVITEEGASHRVPLGGGLRYRVASRAELPAVGDWVVVRCHEGELQTIVGRYERRTRFVRKSAGRSSSAQVIAANVDTVFVVTSMNEEFEPRRLERYLLAVHDAGAEPVVVLNKSDLTDEPEWFVDEAEAVARDATVVGISALHGPIDALEPWLERGRTAVVVGSSGVGKSTLINRLMGTDVQGTREIREDDAKGRHTTTSRQLMVLPGGRGILIDTPGMREFGLAAGDGAVDRVFDDIARLAADCKFRDCEHDDEPGCAVQAALEDGRLTEERLASWDKLQREIAWQRRKNDVALRRREARKLAKKYRKRTKKSPKS